MAWTLKSRPKTKRVTKRFAKTYAEMERAPHDRPLSERRLMVYEKLARQGSFRPVTWAKAWCPETKQWYRVNGKHTSIMLSGWQGPMPEFYVTEEIYNCDTLEDVARLYATFDSKMQSRTTNDINASFAATMPELSEIHVAIISLAVSAISFDKWGEHYATQIQPAERAELLLDNAEFTVWLSDMVNGREGNVLLGKQILKKVPVAACMYACYKKSKQAAGEFWTAVRDETGANPKTPDRKLATLLITTGLRSKDGAKSKMIGARELYVKCIHAWNAWRKKESTDMKYYPESDIPAIK